ncbi:CRTAC1 family protein [Paraliomyxa miuraensis]|uniref:CRTAC1 family protein n=1 Tax=Paraliomyxa miuraensis TaxID=376150 RepID=UPI0022529DB4|nr:CRTAC1 family protein [Paraliomyxa miuraensis]MCX4242150.1 CRTAC1 family protein [Paraliomyxa miuraensis]
MLVVVGWLAGCGGDAAVTEVAGGTSSTVTGQDEASPTTDAPPPDDGTGGPGRHPTSTTSGSTDATSSSDDADTSTGEPEPPVVEPSFVEVAAAAGLTHLHGEYFTAPNCLIDQVGPGTNGFCLPERMTAGAATADYDGDGWPDLMVSRTVGRPLLYRNRGDGSFEEVGLAAGIQDHTWGTSGLAFVDVDNDDDQDLYVVTLGDTRYYLYINDGSGHFTEQAILRNASLKSPNQHAGMSVAVGDYDLDGWTDLYVGEWRTIAGLGKMPSHSRLLHNLGPAAPGHFEDVTDPAGVNVDDVWKETTPLAGIYSFAPSFVDLDGDGWPELSVVADFDCSRLFWNQGDGTFIDGTIASGVGLDRNGMGSAFGDYDRDGDLDWYVTAITNPDGPGENRLYRNDGNRVFTEIAEPMGVSRGGWGWGTTFFDPDNDGDLELMMTGGYYYSNNLAEHAQLWMNDGNGAFGPDVSEAVGLGEIGQGRGLLVFDYDLDGDLDVYLAMNFDVPRLYENVTGNRHDWLRVRARGTTSNRDGLGARVTVQVTEGGPISLHELGASVAHYMGQPDKAAHFGLGWSPDASPVHEVRVYWPASGQEQVFTDVERNIELVVEEPR